MQIAFRRATRRLPHPDRSAQLLVVERHTKTATVVLARIPGTALR